MTKVDKLHERHIKYGGVSNKEWFGLHDTSSQMLLDAAGDNLSQRTIGVILTLAEFFNNDCISDFFPPLKAGSRKQA